MKTKVQHFNFVLKPLFWVCAVISRFFCKHNYLWVRNVYGDEIYMTGKFKRSWWKCNKCRKWQSKEQISELRNDLKKHISEQLNTLHVSNSVKIALLEQLEELSEHIPCEVYTKKVIEIKSNFNDC